MEPVPTFEPLPEPAENNPFEAANDPPTPFPVAKDPAANAGPLLTPAADNGPSQETAAPARPAADSPIQQVGNPPEPAFPELPIAVPAAAVEAEGPAVPDLNAFSAESQSEPAPAPPTAVPPVSQPPIPPEDNPFSDPVLPSTEHKTEAEPVEAPFDPYEPEPAGDSPETTPPVLPGPMPAESDPADPIEPPQLNGPSISAGPAERPVDPAEPKLPASAEVPASPTLSPLPAVPPSNAADPGDPRFGGLTVAPEPMDSAPAAPVDPLDLNPPREASLEELPTGADPPAPGRASVRVPASSSPPLAPPPVDNSPRFPVDPAPSAPQSASENEHQNENPFPTAPESTGTLPPQAEPAGPNLTSPAVVGPETNMAPNVPGCAIPAAGSSQAPAVGPAAFVDPLDQVTFPDADPPTSSPQAQINANPLPETSPPALSTEPKSSPPIQFTDAPSPVSPFPMGTPPLEPGPGSDTPQTAELAELPPAAQQRPQLKIEKTAPPKAVLGQPMIYNIVVRNVGTSAAREVIVEDQIPKGTRLTGTIPRGEMADSRLIWRLGEIPPGEEKKIAVRLIPTQEGQIGSVAKVSFVAEVASQTVVAAPNLDLEFTGPERAVLGDNVTYHFKIANTGTGDAARVFLRNILPKGLKHPDGGDLEYEVGTLKAGESREIDLTVSAAAAGEFVNKAVISASGGLQEEATSNLKIIGDRLKITRTGPKRRYIGRLAAFSNTIANQSDTNVAGFQVVEAVPAGLDFVKATAGGKFDPDKRTVTWAIRELGPREEQELQLELVARNEGKQASEVTAFDPNGTRSVVKSETLIEGYTALRLDVREYAEPVDVGQEVNLRIVATNRGTGAASQVVVKLQIPEELEFVSAKGPVDFKRDGGTLTFNPVESLQGRTELEFDLVLKSVKAGDARLRLEIASEQTTKPLTREEGIRVLAVRP